MQLKVPHHSKYQPQEPYIFQSGKRAGKCMDKMMFDDPNFLFFYLGICRENANGPYKNKPHRHLEWLIQQAQTRRPQMICPYCNKEGKNNIVTCFSVRFSLSNMEPSICTAYTYCDEHKDMFTHPAFGNVELFPFTWLSIKYFIDMFGKKSKFVTKQIIKMYRNIFILPPRLTNSVAFEFFRAQNQAPDNIFH